MKSYKIGTKTYCQEAIVLGQFELLTEYVSGVEFTQISATHIVAQLGRKLYDALAIVIFEKPDSVAPDDIIETQMEDEVLRARAKYLKFHVTAKQAQEIIVDFLECNPISSVLGSVSGLIEMVGKTLNPTTSSEQSGNSVEEILQNADKLSGELQQSELLPG
jgi:hypothetical protein